MERRKLKFTENKLNEKKKSHFIQIYFSTIIIDMQPETSKIITGQ